MAIIHLDDSVEFVKEIRHEPGNIERRTLNAERRTLIPALSHPMGEGEVVPAPGRDRECIDRRGGAPSDARALKKYSSTPNIEHPTSNTNEWKLEGKETA